MARTSYPMPTSCTCCYATASGTIEGMRYDELIIRLIRETDSVEVLQQYAAAVSGYVREEVLKRCIALKPLALLSAVVVRLNDWVPQVRQAARAALEVLLPQASATQLAAVLHELLRLHTHGRGDSAAWLTSFEAKLLQKVTLSDLCAVARAADRRAARAAVSLLDRRGLLAPEAIVQLILERGDDIVLAQRAIELCARLAPDQRMPAYRAAATSHFGAVRTIAVSALLSMQSEAHAEVALAALEDVQSSVRQVAISYLLATDFDARGYYRRVLQQGSHQVQRTRICLSALAGLRDAADVALIKSFQCSEHPGVRAATLLAWFRLAEQDKDRIALAALEDSARGVRKLAVQLVRKYGAYVPLASIVQQLEVHEDVRVPLQLAESNKWNWLECVARICLQRGVEQARSMGLDAAIVRWSMAVNWYDRPNAQQQQLLTSTPVVASFTQLLHPRIVQPLLARLA